MGVLQQCECVCVWPKSMYHSDKLNRGNYCAKQSSRSLHTVYNIHNMLSLTLRSGVIQNINTHYVQVDLVVASKVRRKNIWLEKCRNLTMKNESAAFILVIFKWYCTLLNLGSMNCKKSWFFQSKLHIINDNDSENVKTDEKSIIILKRYTENASIY